MPERRPGKQSTSLLRSTTAANSSRGIRSVLISFVFQNELDETSRRGPDEATSKDRKAWLVDMSPPHRPPCMGTARRRQFTTMLPKLCPARGIQTDRVSDFANPAKPTPPIRRPAIVPPLATRHADWSTAIWRRRRTCRDPRFTRDRLPSGRRNRSRWDLLPAKTG